MWGRCFDLFSPLCPRKSRNVFLCVLTFVLIIIQKLMGFKTSALYSRNLSNEKMKKTFCWHL